jgi:N-ethylmaleimide reductase
MLMTPHRLGRITLSNRVVMAPMTRCRAIGNVVNELHAAYYAARADAGLLITEGTSPSPDGLGYARMPGVFTIAQATAWRAVTDAVHTKGGRIFVQLMHAGRVGHPANLPDGARLVGPSAVAAPGQMWTDAHGMQAHPVPTEMTEADIEAAIQSFVDSAALAVEVGGFDGVELHGANGYLIEQFLNVAANLRTDRWGGSVENRVRFAVEAARRTADRIGADRVGIRLSPYGRAQGHTPDPETDAVYGRLATELGRVGLAYVHVVDHSAMGAPPVPPEVKALIRQNFGGTVIVAGGFNRDTAEAALAEGRGELVAFGRPFLSNPDLVGRLRDGLPLRPPDPSTFYTPGPVGYTELPS